MHPMRLSRGAVVRAVWSATACRTLQCVVPGRGAYNGEVGIRACMPVADRGHLRRRSHACVAPRVRGLPA